MKGWLVLILAGLCAACQTQTITNPTVWVTVEAPLMQTLTPTPECLPVPGVSIEIHPIDASSVGLIAKGLQPGEKPHIVYSASGNGHTTRVEAGPFAQGADPQGAFSIRLSGMSPVGGQLDSTWDIRFIHARGVACAEVTLP